MGPSATARPPAAHHGSDPQGRSTSTDAAGDPAVPGSRAGRTWVALVPAALALVVVLIFVPQNLQSTTVRFVFVSERLPLGVALLVAAALGALIVFCLGSVRILQLRRLARRRSAR
jgi:lipopolysaccharide assembly protein A